MTSLHDAQVASAMLRCSVDLLRCELRKLLIDVIPRSMTVYQAFDGSADLFLVGSYLFRCIPIPQCEGIILEGLEVNGNAQWSPKLVVTGVAFANAGGGVINTV